MRRPSACATAASFTGEPQLIWTIAACAGDGPCNQIRCKRVTMQC